MQDYKKLMGAPCYGRDLHATTFAISHDNITSFAIQSQCLFVASGFVSNCLREWNGRVGYVVQLLKGSIEGFIGRIAQVNVCT